jgi:hypothetical protein
MSLPINQLNPALVTAAFERRLKPRAYDLQTYLLWHHSLTERDHVGVIVLPCQACRLDIPAESATYSFDAVRHHGFAVSRATQDNAAFGPTICYCKSDGANENRIINWLFRVSAKIVDAMTQVNQEPLDPLLVLEASVV